MLLILQPTSMLVPNQEGVLNYIVIYTSDLKLTNYVIEYNIMCFVKSSFAGPGSVGDVRRAPYPTQRGPPANIHFRYGPQLLPATL